MLFDYSNKYCFFDPFSMFLHVNRLNNEPLLTEHELNMEYVSPLFHELTHYDCLSSDFGISLVLGIHWLKKMFHKFGEDEYVKTSDGGTIPVQMRGVLTAKYLPNLGCAIPILEGLATFHQLDYLSSREYDVSTQHWSVALYLQSSRPSVKKNPQTLKQEVHQFFETLHTFNLRDQQLFYKTHFGVKRNNSYYLFGYIYVKTLAELLRRRDERLSDPELCYIFLRNYLFNGSDFRDPSNFNVSQFLNAYQERFEMLEGTDPRLISEIVDIIAIEEDAKGYNELDIYNAIKGLPCRKPPMLSTVLEYCLELELQPAEIIPYMRAAQFMNIKLCTFKIAFLTLADLPTAASGYHPVILMSPGDGSYMFCYLPKSKANELAALIERNGKQLLDSIDFANLQAAFDLVSAHLENFQDIKEMLTIDSDTSLPVRIMSVEDFVYAVVDLGENTHPGIISMQHRLQEEFETLSSYLSIDYRNSMTNFLFDFYSRNMPFLGGFIMDFNLFVYRKMMNFPDGSKLIPFLENGFSLLGLDSVDQRELGLTYDPTKRQCNKMTEKMNSLLKYPFY